MAAEAREAVRWWHVSAKTRDTLQLVAVFGTLAVGSLAWLDSRINRVEDRLDARMDRLEERMDRLEERMDARMDRLEERMEEGFRAVNARLDALMLVLVGPEGELQGAAKPAARKPAGGN